MKMNSLQLIKGDRANQKLKKSKVLTNSLSENNLSDIKSLIEELEIKCPISGT